MSDTVHRVNSFFRRLSRFQFVLILSIILWLLAALLNIIFSSIESSDSVFYVSMDMNKGFLQLVFTPLIVAPIVETFVCQYLPYYFLSKISIFNQKKYLILITSALIFGLMHFSSLFYMIYGVIIGMVLMYGYMIKVAGDKRTFLLIVLCHSILNLGILIRNVL